MPGKKRFIPPIDDYSILSDATLDAENGRNGDSNKLNQDNNLLIRKKYSGDQTSISSAESDGDRSYSDEESHHHISDHSSDDNRSYNDGSYRDRSNSYYSDQSYSKESHSNMSDSGQERSAQERSIDVSETSYDDSRGLDGQQFSVDDSQDSRHRMNDDNSLTSCRPIHEMEDESQESGGSYRDDDAGSRSSRGQGGNASYNAGSKSNHSRGRRRLRDDYSSYQDNQSQNSYSQDDSRDLRGSQRNDDSQISRSDQDDRDGSLAKRVTCNDKTEEDDPAELSEHAVSSDRSKIKSLSPLTEPSIAHSKDDSSVQHHVVGSVQDESIEYCGAELSHARLKVSDAHNPRTPPLHIISESKDNHLHDTPISNNPVAEEADTSSDEEEDDEVARRKKLEKLVTDVMPEQLSNLDFLLEQFADREEELITALREMAANPRYSASNFDSSFSVTSTELPDSDEENLQGVHVEKDDDSEISGSEEIHAEDDEGYHSESMSSEYDDNEDANDGVEASEELGEEGYIDVSRSSGRDNNGNDNEGSYTEEEVVDETWNRDEDQESGGPHLEDTSNTGDGNDDHGSVEEVWEEHQYFDGSQSSNRDCTAYITETSYTEEEVVDEIWNGKEAMNESQSSDCAGNDEVSEKCSDHEAGDGAVEEGEEWMDKSRSGCHDGIGANTTFGMDDQGEENGFDELDIETNASLTRRPVEENKQECFDALDEDTRNSKMYANASHNEAEQEVSQRENDGIELEICGSEYEHFDGTDDFENQDGATSDASHMSLNFEQDGRNGSLGEMDTNSIHETAASIYNNEESQSSVNVNIEPQVESEIHNTVAREKSSESQGSNTDYDGIQNEKDLFQDGRDCTTVNSKSVRGDKNVCSGNSKSKADNDKYFEYDTDVSQSVYDDDMTRERHEEYHSSGSALSDEGKSSTKKHDDEYNELCSGGAKTGLTYRKSSQLSHDIDDQNDSLRDGKRYAVPRGNNGYVNKEMYSQGSKASAIESVNLLEINEMNEAIDDCGRGLEKQLVVDEDIECKRDSMKNNAATVIGNAEESESSHGSSGERTYHDIVDVAGDDGIVLRRDIGGGSGWAYVKQSSENRGDQKEIISASYCNITSEVGREPHNFPDVENNVDDVPLSLDTTKDVDCCDENRSCTDGNGERSKVENEQCKGFSCDKLEADQKDFSNRSHSSVNSNHACESESRMQIGNAFAKEEYNGISNDQKGAEDGIYIDYSNNTQSSLHVDQYEAQDGTYGEGSDREQCNESVYDINNNEDKTEDGDNDGFMDSSRCIENAHDSEVYSEMQNARDVYEVSNEYADDEDFYNNRTQSFRNTSNVHVNDDEEHGGNTGLSQFNQFRERGQQSEPDNECQSNSSFADDDHDEPNLVPDRDNDDSRGLSSCLDGEDEYEEEDQDGTFGDGDFDPLDDYYRSDGSQTSGSSHGQESESESKLGHFDPLDDYYRSDGSQTSGSSHGQESESESKLGHGSFADGEYHITEAVNAKKGQAVVAHYGDYSNKSSSGRNVDDEYEDDNDDLDHDETNSDGEVADDTDEYCDESNVDERDPGDYGGGDGSQSSHNIDNLHERWTESNNESQNNDSFAGSAPGDGDIGGREEEESDHDDTYSDGLYSSRNVDDEYEDDNDDLDHDETNNDGEVADHSDEYCDESNGDERDPGDYGGGDGSQSSHNIDNLHESEPQFKKQNIQSQNNDTFADEGCNVPDCDDLEEASGASDCGGEYSDGSRPGSVNDDCNYYYDDGDIDESTIVDEGAPDRGDEVTGNRSDAENQQGSDESQSTHNYNNGNGSESNSEDDHCNDDSSADADYQAPYAGDAEVEGIDDEYSNCSDVDDEDGDYNDDRNSGGSYNGDEHYNESDSDGDDNDADDFGGYGDSDRSQSSHDVDKTHDSISEPESESDQESQEDGSFADEEYDTAHGGHLEQGDEVVGRDDSNSSQSYSGGDVSDEYDDSNQLDHDENHNDSGLANHDDNQYNESDGNENNVDEYKGSNGSQSSHSIDNLHESKSEFDRDCQKNASFADGEDQGGYAGDANEGEQDSAHAGEYNAGSFFGRDVDDEDNDYDADRDYDETNSEAAGSYNGGEQNNEPDGDENDASKYEAADGSPSRRSFDIGHEFESASLPDNDSQDDGSFADEDNDAVHGGDAEGEEVAARDGDYNHRSFSGRDVDAENNEYGVDRDYDETNSDAAGSYSGDEQENEPRDYHYENDANSKGGSDGSQSSRSIDNGHEFESESESETDNDSQNEGSFADEEYNAAYGGDTEEIKDITARSGDNSKGSQCKRDIGDDNENVNYGYGPDQTNGNGGDLAHDEDHFNDFKNEDDSGRSQSSHNFEDRLDSRPAPKCKSSSDGRFVAESQVGDDAGEREVANHEDGYRHGTRARGNVISQYDSEDDIAQYDSDVAIDDNGGDRLLSRKALLQSEKSAERSVNSYEDKSARGDDEDSETSHSSQCTDNEAKTGYNDATHAMRDVDYEYENDSSYGDDEHSEPTGDEYSDGSQPLDDDIRYESDEEIGEDNRSRSELQSALSKDDESSSAHYSEGLVYAKHVSPGFDQENEALTKYDGQESPYENDSFYDDDYPPTESDEEKSVPIRHAGNKARGSGSSRSRNESRASDQFSGSWKKSEHSEYVMDFSASQEAKESLAETDTEFFPAFDDYERPIHPSPAAEKEHSVPNKQIQSRTIAYGGEKSDYDDAGYSEEDYDYEYEKDYEASVEHAPSSGVHNEVKASFNRQDDAWDSYPAEKSYYNKQSSIWGIPLKHVILMLLAAIVALVVAIIVLSLRGPDTRVVTISSDEETNSTQATTLSPTTADSLSQSPVASPTASIAPAASGANVFTSGDTVVSTSREPIEGTASNLSEKLCVQYLSGSQGYENACFSTEYNRNGLALRCQIEFDGIVCSSCEICFGTNSTTNLPFIGFEADCGGLEEDETTATCTLLDSSSIQAVLVDDVFSGQDIWAFAGEPPSSAPPLPTSRPSSGTTSTPTSNPAPTKCFTSREELVNAVDLYLLGETLEYLEATYGDEIGNWCFSGIQDLSELFSSNRIRAAASFNADLSNWDVSSVTNFTSMFEGASRFNADLSSWTVSNATTMVKMFSQASSFSSDLSTWSVSSVTDMSGMFSWASSFNSDLSDWDVSRAQRMEQLFLSASAFNQDLSSWQLDSIRSMKEMFRGCRFFAQNLCTWGEQLEGRTDVDTTQMFSLTQCEETGEVNWELSPPGPLCFECNSQSSYFEWDSLLDTSTQELLELAAPSSHSNVFDRAAQ
jgi:hypothetical protein